MPFGCSFYERGICAFLSAPSLLQFRYPAFHSAYNYTLALPSGLFLKVRWQVLQFSSSAFYYFYSWIHKTLHHSD